MYFLSLAIPESSSAQYRLDSKYSSTLSLRKPDAIKMHSKTQKPPLVVDNFLNDKVPISFIKIIIKINTFYAFVNTFNEYLIKTASMVVKSDSKYLIVVVWRFKIIFFERNSRSTLVQVDLW